MPRALTQMGLEKVLATSKKTQVAASEYSGSRLQDSDWRRPKDSDKVQAVINGISRLLVSGMINQQ